MYSAIHLVSFDPLFTDSFVGFHWRRQSFTKLCRLSFDDCWQENPFSYVPWLTGLTLRRPDCYQRDWRGVGDFGFRYLEHCWYWMPYHDVVQHSCTSTGCFLVKYRSLVWSLINLHSYRKRYQCYPVVLWHLWGYYWSCYATHPFVYRHQSFDHYLSCSRIADCDSSNSSFGSSSYASSSAFTEDGLASIPYSNCL